MWVSTSNSLRGWAWFVKKKFRGRSFWGTKITPKNVHEVTQKMRKWLKKYMNFHSVFRKNYDTRQNFPRPPVATSFMYGAEQKDKTQVDTQKVLWFAAHLCCKSYETLSPKKCRSHACICVNNVYFYRSIRYCCELKLETASSASALTTATRCISQDGVHPANVETTQSSLNYSAHFDLTQQLLSYYHFR